MNVFRAGFLALVSLALLLARPAPAHDGAIASGKYGMATYRATARWEKFWVFQP
jgi:hypothetical protein